MSTAQPIPDQQATWGFLARRAFFGVLLFGAVVQIALITYYLGAGHSPQPRDLPVGYIASNTQASEVRTEIVQGGRFAATRYDSVEDLTDAITAKAAYGGVDITGSTPHLYTATAAGPSAANAIRTVFTAVVEQQRTAAVSNLTASGSPISTTTLSALTTPPTITDVVALPAADSGGTAIGFLVQVLVVGATVASTELGKFGAHTRRSASRGLAHAGVLVLYALASAAAVSAGASIFNVIPGSALPTVFLSFALLSLALSCSVAGAVALFGRAGAMLGTLYFLVGLVVSGASILPEFLPTWARVFGQSFPPGAGATLIRERLYFPTADVIAPALLLTAFAVIGLLVVVVTNALPSSWHPDTTGFLKSRPPRLVAGSEA